MPIDYNNNPIQRFTEVTQTVSISSGVLTLNLDNATTFLTTRNANITTLIAAAILFVFGTGPVKGFAITLGVGIVTTLFSAYFIARHLTSLVVLNDREGKYFKL